MTSNPIDYRAVLEDIEAKIKKLQAAAEAIRDLVSVTDVPPVAGTVNGQTVGVGMFFDMSIAEAIEKHLDAVKRPKTPVDIAKALEQGGFPHTSKDFLATVRSALFREIKKSDAKIVKRPDGDYGLAAWYPGLRKQARFGAQGGTDATQEEQPASEKLQTDAEIDELFADDAAKAANKP